jgi:hypothetical protein
MSRVPWEMPDHARSTTPSRASSKPAAAARGEGVAIRIKQRVLAMAAAICHNNKTGAPIRKDIPGA